MRKCCGCLAGAVGQSREEDSTAGGDRRQHGGRRRSSIGNRVSGAGTPAPEPVGMGGHCLACGGQHGAGLHTMEQNPSRAICCGVEHHQQHDARPDCRACLAVLGRAAWPVCRGGIDSGNAGRVDGAKETSR